MLRCLLYSPCSGSSSQRPCCFCIGLPMLPAVEMLERRCSSCSSASAHGILSLQPQARILFRWLNFQFVISTYALSVCPDCCRLRITDPCCLLVLKDTDPSLSARMLPRCRHVLQGVVQHQRLSPRLAAKRLRAFGFLATLELFLADP